MAIALNGAGDRRFEGLPWTQRLVEAAPWAPAWVGLALAAAQLCLIAAYKTLVGEPPQLLPDAVFALLVGFAPAASVYARRASLACLHDLQSVLDVPEARFAQTAADVVRWDFFWARLVGVPTVLIVMLVVLNEPGVVGPYPPGHPMLPMMLWINVAAIWLTARTITQEIIVSRRFSRLARAHAVVDVLDQLPLMPFARRGLQAALVPILAISIFSLLFVTDSAGDAVPLTQILVIAIAAVSLILPVQGVHLQIVQQKQQRLERLAASIREAEEPVLAARPGEAASPAAHLHALLALRGQIVQAPDWPWDVPTLLRFGFYVAIGVGSWLGGALVERVVDAVLG